MAAHGAPRATGNLDIWICATPDNAARVLEAPAPLRRAVFDLTMDDLSTPDTVFQIGLPPSRIDILSSISGVAFDQAWPNRLEIHIGDLDVSVIGRGDFIANKTASGRPKDLMDLTLLPPT